VSVCVGVSCQDLPVYMCVSVSRGLELSVIKAK